MDSLGKSPGASLATLPLQSGGCLPRWYARSTYQGNLPLSAQSTATQLTNPRHDTPNKPGLSRVVWLSRPH